MSRPVRRRPRTGAALAAVVTAAVVVLAACSSGHARSQSVGGSAAGPSRQGGTLRYALFYSPTCLDPQQAGEGPDLGVVESLTAQNPNTGAVVASLAASWEVRGDATSFTFHLRPNVTFSDGSALTSTVVAQNLNAIRRLGATASHAGAYLAALTSVDTPDPRTVTITFNRPNAQFLQATATPALAIESAASLARPAGERCAGKIVGTGPFVVDSYTPNQQIVIKRRAGYAWAPSSAGHQGPARLDQVRIAIVTNETTRTGSLLSHQFDVISNVTPQDEPRVRAGGFSVLSRTDPGVVLSLWPNEKRPTLANRDIRVAISRAIDRQDIIATLYTPQYKPATSVLSSTTPGYTDLGRDLARDPASARALLDAAGWKPGPDGIRVRGGQRLTLDVIFGLPRSLELIQQQLHAVGVDLRLRQLSISELQAQFAAGNYDFFLGNSARADPDVLRTLFAGFTITGASADPLTAALNGQAASVDTAVRNRDAAIAQRLLVTDAHDIPITELAEVVAASDKVHDLRFNANASLNFYDAWLS
ncbi:peptide/nickel transport system substrate-binding protein [Frankia sp. AiPs1]|uniref:ABC transporter substrate-binding protein n=1 Tax=Frankia sp. AiPa1 TaxID=573492 RepID=UPI00202B1130|nr:ABC transporter substrate-binding protein [Frankia sp. AiPa1]MCL9760516.1 ABC transporter substrate-binding protein [Frankia sp. AiPa1]